MLENGEMRLVFLIKTLCGFDGNFDEHIGLIFWIKVFLGLHYQDSRTYLIMFVKSVDAWVKTRN